MSSDNARPEHLTMSETARLLGVSRWTVRRMVRENELDAIEVRGMLRVGRSSVERYVSQHRHNSDGGH